MGVAPELQFRDTVRAPAAAKELDNQRAEREQIGGANRLSRERIGQGKLRHADASAKNTVFNAGGEELGGMLLRDCQALRLNQGARVLGNAVEFVLKRWQWGFGH